MNHQEMLNIIENGLAGATRPKTVIIVGAGMAGLAAGDLLKRAGHTVTILEAQHRVGGRVYTVREGLAPGLRAEMGATRFPQSHQLTMAYIDRFQLATEPFLLSNANAFLRLQGKQVQRKAFDPQQFLFDVHPQELGKTPEDLLKATFKPFYDLIQAKGDAAWDDIIEHYDQFSLGEYLRHAGWSAGAIAMLGLLGNAEFRMDASFVSFLREEYTALFSGMVYQIGRAHV